MKNQYKKRFFALKLIFSTAAFGTVLLSAFTVLHGLLPGMLVKAEEDFINRLVAFRHTADMQAIITSYLLVALILLLEWLLDIASKYICIVNRESIRKNVYQKMFSAVENMAFDKLEIKDNQDLITRVFKSPEIHLSTLIESVLLLLKYMVTISSLFLLLFSQIGIQSFIIIGASIVIAVIAKRGGQRVYHLEVENSSQKREVNYYDSMLTDKEFADERILFSFFKKINDRWQNKSTRLIKQKARLDRTVFMQKKAASVVLYLISFAIIIILIEPVKSGTVTIGFMVAFVHATFNLSTMVSKVLGDVLGKISKELGYIKDFWELQNLSAAQRAHYGSKTLDAVDIIEFCNVSFKYPGTEKYVLKNCSFKMEGNKRFALIGINGAGKSTIIKLLKGLYSDYEGAILVNHVNLREFSRESLSAEIAVVNQDFSKFQVSFLENINLGRKNEIHDHARVLEIFKKLNFDKLVNHMSLNSRIGKIYPENIDLSLGEWQKVAIGRAILSDASLLVLDEPTASLDPVAEQQVYKEIADLSKNKMSVLISHRLGSVKSSDDIYLLEEGQVKIHGSHEELMRDSDLYREMYNRQKGWYQNE